MRCPKCGYISFDHNVSCPNCSRDLSAEQKKLNLPPFMPDPLPLLTALINSPGESQIGSVTHGMTDTLELDHLPEVSIAEPQELEVKSLAGEQGEEVEIELHTSMGREDEDLVVDLGTEEDGLEGLEELEIDEDLLQAKEEGGTRELEMDTAEMVTQELGEAQDTMTKESGEFDFGLELEGKKAKD